MAITIIKPVIGGDENNWGSKLDSALDTIVDAVNGTSGTTAPNLSTLTINGTNVTSTAAELNALDGFTGVVADLNYAKDLRATGVTSTEFNKLDGLTATTAELNKLDGVTATTADLNKLDGVTATTAELNYVDGVTSNIQTQLNSKQATITGGATTIDTENLTASRVLVSNSSGKVAVSSVTSTELSKLDGFTGTATDLNYAKDLRATGVTTTEFDKLDGNTSRVQITWADADGIVMNDNGTMTQATAQSLKQYVLAGVSSPTVNNSTITISAGNALTGGGSITLNQSSNETVTINHQDTSSQSSVNNSGSTYIQDITLDGYGHVTGITSTDASSNISARFTRGTTSAGATSFSASAGMYMLQIYNTSTNAGGGFNLPTSNVEFGMLNMIKGTSNTQNAVSVGYFYDGTDWHANSNTTNAVTILDVTNSTSGTQNVSYAWGFLTLTGSVTLTTTQTYVKFNIIKVA